MVQRIQSFEGFTDGLRINDEEEKPDDYAEDVVVAGNCDTRRVKVAPKRWTHMVKRNVINIEVFIVSLHQVSPPERVDYVLCLIRRQKDGAVRVDGQLNGTADLDIAVGLTVFVSRG